MVDRLTPERRSRLMSRVGSKDTDIETALRSALHGRGFRFRKHVRELPGKPDVVFSSVKVAVFVDGDFWHGFEFKVRGAKLPEFWRKKIETNRRRDMRNFLALRRMGWRVLRIWGHSIKADTVACADRVARAVTRRRAMPKP